MANQKDDKDTKQKHQEQQKEKTGTKKASPKDAFDEIKKSLENTIFSLESQLRTKEAEIVKNINDFQEKAKGFSTKAQEEVNRLKEELAAKLEVEKNEVKKWGSQKVFEVMIEPLLNIELAIESGKNNEAVHAYVAGFEMLLKSLWDGLEAFGLKAIIPQVGEEFNPHLHYALEKHSDSNLISKLVKKGFLLHDRVIKPATVIVGKVN